MARCVRVRVVTLSDCPPGGDSARLESGIRSNLNSSDTGNRAIDPNAPTKPKTLPLGLLALLRRRRESVYFRS
jgi:hypothetical protein